MATCLQSVTALMAGPGIESLTVINPNTNTPLSFSPTTNQLLLAQMQIQQTVTFTVGLSSSIPGAFNASLTIYQIIGSGPSAIINSYASINFSSTSTSFSKDFQTGNYVFCFHANNTSTYTGNIIGSFIAIPSSATFNPIFTVGEAIRLELTIPSPPRVCSQVMFYEVVDGELPPGVFLDELGTLRGTLPNLDCTPPDMYGNDYSPSFNWFYQRGELSYPLGRQWRFKVRLTLATNDQVYTEDWFCIRIFNNWDFDRDNFVAQEPFDHTTTTTVYDPPPKIEPICEDCTPETTQNFIPKTFESQCVPCDSPPETSQVTLIPIPEELKAVPPSQFTSWYTQNQDVDYSNSCPAVQTFINNLKGSNLFNKLLVQNGLAPSTEPTPLELFIATTFQNYLQIASTRLTNGRNSTDIDSQLLQWQFEQNQSNPIFIDVISGELIPPFELVFSPHG